MGLIAVVIPGKNEEKTIRRCVQSVLDAGISSDDIYIIDDGSDDNMYEEACAPFEISMGDSTRSAVLEKNILRRDKNKEYDEYGKHGKSESIRAAVQYFQLTERYRFIGPLDADTRVASNYYSQIIAMFEDRKAQFPLSYRVVAWCLNLALISRLLYRARVYFGLPLDTWAYQFILPKFESGLIGTIIYLLMFLFPRFQKTFESYTRMDKVAIVHGHVESVPRNWITAFRALEYIVTQWLYKKTQDDLGAILVAPGCASVWRSEVFAELDFSGDTLVEDMVWTIHSHIKRLGRVCYAPGAIVYTQDPDTMSGYARQIDRWNTGFWQVMRKFRMPLHFRRVEVEMLVMVVEGILFSGLYILLPFLVLDSLYEIIVMHHQTEVVSWADLIFNIKLAPLSMAGMDISVMCIQSFICYAIWGRKDVLKYCLLFPVLRYVNAVVFFYAFIKVIILRKNPQFWFSPKRYSA